LKSRYTIDKLVGEGSYGQIFKIIDKKDPKTPLVIKTSYDCKILAREINYMNQINTKAKQIRQLSNKVTSNIPEILDYGMLSHS
jgi:serine/threonine protein kinase